MASTICNPPDLRVIYSNQYVKFDVFRLYDTEVLTFKQIDRRTQQRMARNPETENINFICLLHTFAKKFVVDLKLRIQFEVYQFVIKQIGIL